MSEMPQKLSKVLVASDLSAQSALAIERAVELGIEHGGEVIIVHVVDESLPADAQSFMMTTSDHHIRQTIGGLAHADQAEITIDIVAGRPELDVVERAEIEGADCIVVGLHSRLLAENLAIEGTLAEQIIRATHKPVLVVKDKPKGRYRTVLAGVDFSAFSRAGVRAANLLAPNAVLYLLHAFEGAASGSFFTRLSDESSRGKYASAYRERLEVFIGDELRRLAEDGAAAGRDASKVHFISEEGQAHEVLKSQAERLSADLIVLGTHGRVGVARAVLGSVARDIINDRLTDVLVVRPY